MRFFAVLAVLACAAATSAAYEGCSEGRDPLASEVSFGTDPADIATKFSVSNPAAVCLDGSRAAYYIARSSTNSTGWVIYLQGGGWCTSLEDCLARSKTRLGSSLGYKANMSFSGVGILSHANSPFSTFNRVWLPYCDGASFAGNNATTVTVSGQQLHFSGIHVLNGVLSDLTTQFGLGSASEVVLSGCSAGGLATYLHADHVRASVPSAGKFGAVPDSGFFLRYGESHGKNYMADMLWVAKAQNVSTNAACEAAMGGAECFFAQNVVQYVQAPLYAQNSRYDSWQTANILGVNRDDPASAPAINSYGDLFMTTLKSTLLKTGHSGFFDSCSHHCGVWNVIHINGTLVESAVRTWWDNLPAGTSPSIQDGVFPCKSCCA